MDPTKCPRCHEEMPPESLVYALGLVDDVWYQICQWCGHRFTVSARRRQGNPGREAGGGRP